MAREGVDAAAVVDPLGEVVGSVSREALARMAPVERAAPLAGVTVRVALRAGQSLEDGMRTLAEAGTDSAPVVDGRGPTGVVTATGILRAYRAAVARGRFRSPFPAEA